MKNKNYTKTSGDAKERKKHINSPLHHTPKSSI